ncbi:MAG TPA: hypothetical protein PK668_26565 [Myxococcota bacterium]|nr:hypothetical protein [Myxococcota bacterium]HRY97092.1 hypothetical protein [Myxococcota bacterium]
MISALFLSFCSFLDSEEYASDISTTSASLPLTSERVFVDCTSAYSQGPSLTSLSALNLLFALSGLMDEDVSFSWHYSGSISSLWGDNASLPFSISGCVGGDAASNVMCFLRSNHDALSINADDLRLLRQRRLPGGIFLLFQQTLNGVDIDGATVRVTVSEDNLKIINIFSSYVNNIVPLFDTADVLAVEIPSFDTFPENIRVVIQEVSPYFRISTSPVLFVFVDQRNYCNDALLAWKFQVVGDNNRMFEVIITSDNTRIISISPKGDADAPVSVWTGTAYLDYTEDDCDPFCPRYSSCWSDSVNQCSTCVSHCTDEDCLSSFGDGWSCLDDGEFANACNFPYWGSEHLDGQLRIFDDLDGGWQFVGSSVPALGIGCIHHYSNALTAITYYRDHILDDELGYGVNSWDQQGGPIALHMFSYCSPTCPNASLSGNLDTLELFLPIWGFYDLDFSATQYPDIAYKANLFVTLGHEGGHGIQRYLSGGGLSYYDCMNENMAHLSGALLSHYVMPDDSWTVGDRVYSAWQDQTCGLSNCLGTEWSVPYSQRSRFDWLPCDTISHDVVCDVLEPQGSCDDGTDCLVPYHRCLDLGYGKKCYYCSSRYYNYNVWRRFARLLAEGSAILDDDNKNENIGVVFEGVGQGLASKIVYYAWDLLDRYDGQLDFSEALLASGSFYSKSTNVKLSLGAAGFPGGTYSVGIVTNRTPAVLTWSQWQQSSVKTFYIYKDSANYNLRIRYHNGSSWNTWTLAANTDDSPSAIVFNDNLHVFWRDKDTNEIKLMAYESNGTSHGIYNLGTLGIYSRGAFDTTIFQNNLYLAYVYPQENIMSISRCTVTSGYCTTNPSSWNQYWPNPVSYRKNFAGYSTTSGIGVTSGSSLNGIEAGDKLYALLSSAETGDNYLRLGVLCIDTNDIACGNQNDFRWLSDTFKVGEYDTFTANYGLPRAMEFRNAAFPSSGRYLYLAWNVGGYNDIYVSVLQNWNYFTEAEDARERAFFTRPISIERNEDASVYGVRMWRHNTAEMTGYVYTTADSYGSYGKYKPIYTRY